MATFITRRPSIRITGEGVTLALRSLEAAERVAEQLATQARITLTR